MVCKKLHLIFGRSGCIVLEMLTTNPPWGLKGDMNGDEIITRIGEFNESPVIVSTFSRLLLVNHS
ncbi:hypothetical protein Hanom_Chr04g00295671 [Helianthus anomalus]